MKNKTVKTFEQHSGIPGNKVYILSSDGHRDSANLTKCSVDEAGIIKLLIEEEAEFGNEVLPDTVKIDYDKRIMRYKKMEDGDVEDGKWGFFILSVV